MLTCTCMLTSGILWVYHYLNPVDSLDQHHHHLYLYSTRKVERIISNYFVIRFTPNHLDRLILTCLCQFLHCCHFQLSSSLSGTVFFFDESTPLLLLLLEAQKLLRVLFILAVSLTPDHSSQNDENSLK